MNAPPQNFPLNTALKAILVYFLRDGPKRFSDLQRAVPKISQRMLTLDLKTLEKAGIISRRVLAEGPVKVEYQLTPIGTELGMIVHQLAGFGEKNIEFRLF